MGYKKLIASLLSSPFIMEILTHYAPYFPYIQSVTYLVIGDIITGIMSACYEKYGSYHPALLIRTYKSTRLLKKFFIGFLFFLGLHYIDSSDVLLIKLGMTQYEAGIYWCVAYGIYELSSIMENFGRMDFPVAKQVRRWINTKVPDEMKQEDKKDDSKS